MSSDLHRVLVWGHSFVDFNFASRARVSLSGHGGCTVPKLWSCDLLIVSRLLPDLVILEIGTNDLSTEEHSLIAASIEVLVRLLHDRFSVEAKFVCHVIPRCSPCAFNDKVAACNELVRSLVAPLPYVFCWFHKGFYTKAGKLLLADGVHVNRLGQYRLYRSYRAAILHALSLV